MVAPEFGAQSLIQGPCLCLKLASEDCGWVVSSSWVPFPIPAALCSWSGSSSLKWVSAIWGASRKMGASSVESWAVEGNINQWIDLVCKPYFYHDNSRRVWHGNVHDSVKVFDLGGIDLLRCCCGRASTETCYCQYIHNMLLWACKKCCCTYNIYEITPIYYIHESPHRGSMQVELGKVEGFWSMA